MFKKLFFTAAAATAVSVPLAGAAWATPSDTPNNPPGHPDPSSLSTGPGIPHEFGGYADSLSLNSPVPLNPNGPGQPVPPGQEINIAKDMYPGVSTPVAVGNFVNGVYTITGTLGTEFGPTPPGMAVKTFTPACTSGHVAYDKSGTVSGTDLCH